MLASRDGVVAQLLRALMRSGQNLPDTVGLSTHPLHGHVYRVDLSPCARHAFARLYVRVLGDDGTLCILDRVARSVLV